MVAFIFGIRVIKFDKAKYATVTASDWLENTQELNIIFALLLMGKKKSEMWQLM